MRHYDVKTYTREERIARANELADVMEDMVHYHYDEIANDEPDCVRVRTMRELGKRLLEAARRDD